MLRNALGYAQLRAGEPELAIESLRGALDLAPATAVIRNNLLLALIAGGQAPTANAMLDQIRDERERDLLRGKLTAEAARLPIRKDK